MTQTLHERTPDPWLTELAAVLEPPTLTVADRTRFDATLFARLQPQGSSWIAYLAWVPAAMAAALLVAAPMAREPAQDWLTPLVDARGAMTAQADSWTDGEAQTPTVRDPLAAPDPSGDLARLLPGDYSALAAWLDTTKLDTPQKENQGATPNEARPL